MIVCHSERSEESKTVYHPSIFRFFTSFRMTGPTLYVLLDFE